MMMMMMVLIINRPSDRPTECGGGGNRGASGSDALQGRRQFPSHGMLTYASVGKLAFVWNHASLRYKGKIREREQELDYRVTLKGSSMGIGSFQNASEQLQGSPIPPTTTVV